MLKDEETKMRHRKHNVLGGYCWTCKRPTQANIPGWPKPRRNDGSKVYAPVGYVRWQDMSIDTERVCFECDNHSCKNPVLSKLSPKGDGYREIITKSTYWDWVEGNCPKDDAGLFIEPVYANPDVLPEK